MSLWLTIVLNSLHHVFKLQFMKFFLNFLSVILLLLGVYQLNAQCPTTLTFCSQDSVNAFPKTYPGCREVHSLRIDALHCEGELNDIVNLDSLYPLVSVGYLELHSPSTIKDIGGLSNLRKVYQANISAQKSWKTPLILDTVDDLSYYFPPDTISDLTLLSKIKFVSRSISFAGKGELAPKLNYNTDDNLKIGIADNNINNKIQNVLPKNLSGSKIDFSLIDAQNIDFDFGYKVDSLLSLGLTKSESNDFSTLKDVKKIGYFRLTLANSTETLKQFKCEDIGSLFFTYCSANVNIGELFPNLKKINKALCIAENQNLESINLLDNCELPFVKPNPNEINNHAGILNGRYIYYIFLKNNPKLITCESDYLCRSFKRFGDTIYVGGNQMDCNDVLLQKQCTLSSANEETSAFQSFTFSPNPVFDKLYISPMPKGTRYRVINQLGIPVKSGELADNLSFAELPSGHYFIQLYNPYIIHQPPKVIKVMKI